MNLGKHGSGPAIGRSSPSILAAKQPAMPRPKVPQTAEYFPRPPTHFYRKEIFRTSGQYPSGKIRGKNPETLPPANQSNQPLHLRPILASASQKTRSPRRSLTAALASKRERPSTPILFALSPPPLRKKRLLFAIFPAKQWLRSAIILL